MYDLEPNIFWGCLLFFLLMPLVLADLRSWVLPNSLNLLLAIVGGAQSLSTENPSIQESVLGALVASMLFFAVAKCYQKFRAREGLGMGDVKLVAAGALWIGWSYVGVMVLIAAWSAIAFVTAQGLRKRNLDIGQPIPFGPFLALGIYGAWLLRHSNFAYV